MATLHVLEKLVTRHDVPVEPVLEAAKCCRTVLVIGETLDGKPYCASSIGDKCEILWLIETFKQALLTGQFDIEE